MPIVECQSSDEYRKKLDELHGQRRRITAVYLYWYEGAGTRRLVVPPGRSAEAMFKTLSLEDQLKLNFAVHSPEQFPPEIRQLAKQYRECLAKDFEDTGGYTACEGAPEDAVIVIEHE